MIVVCACVYLWLGPDTALLRSGDDCSTVEVSALCSLYYNTMGSYATELMYSHKFSPGENFLANFTTCFHW